MKNHTLQELTKQVTELNLQISTLKTELGANTQATGKNTIAVEGITHGLKELAKETGAWREDDKQHHQTEDDKDQKKIEKMDALETAVKNLVTVLRQR